MNDKTGKVTTIDSVMLLLRSAWRLARQKAIAATIDFWSMPNVYGSIGKRIAALKVVPADLVQLRDSVTQLEGRVVLTVEKPSGDQGWFAARTKKIVAGAVQTFGNATRGVRLKAACAALGKQAVHKYGEKAIPKEVLEAYRSLLAQRDALATEIESLTAGPGYGSITPARLTFVGFLLCFVVLGYLVWTTSALVVGSVVSLAGNAAHESSASYSRSGRPLRDWGIQQGVRVNRDTRDTNRVMAATLGDEASGHYSECGYGGVALGTTRAQLDATTPLVNHGAHTGFTFHYEDKAGLGKSFVFNEKDRLVCIGQRYVGGADEHLNELIAIFGKTSEDRIRTSDQSPFGGQAKVVYTTVDYTFPKVLVRVIFDEQAHASFGVRRFTHVWVLDRGWAEEILREATARSRRALDWLAASSDMLKDGSLDPHGVPAIPGTRVDVLNEDRANAVVAVVDLAREAELTLRWPEAATNLATCAKVQVGVEPGAMIHCFRCLETQIGDVIKEERLVQEVPEAAETVQRIPIMGDLLWGLNQYLMESWLPPIGGQVTRVRQPALPEPHEWVEWVSDDANGYKWKVVCNKNRQMSVMCLGRSQ